MPASDDQEFFVSAWCFDPRFIPDENIIFIPEPRVRNTVEGALEELLGLRYLFQDWTPAPPSPDYGGPGPEDNDDIGTPDSNINRYDPGLDDRPRGSPTDGDDGPSEDGSGSGDNNHSRFHPGFDCCHGAGSPLAHAAAPRTADEAGGHAVAPAAGTAPTLLKSLLVGSVPCPLRESGLLVSGPGEPPCGASREAVWSEIPDVPSGSDPASARTPVRAESCLANFSDRWVPEHGAESTPRVDSPVPC